MPRHRIRSIRTRVIGSTLAGALVIGTIAAGGISTSALAADLTATPHTYYVDCSKKTNGIGTQAAPWNSVARISQHGVYIPGDAIRLKRGTTCSGRITPQGSGSSGHPIVLGSYGSGARPKVNGHATPNGTATVQLTNQHDWTVQDLHITNAGTTKNPDADRSGLLFLNSGGGRLANLTAKGLLIDTVYSNPGGGGARSYGGISALTSGKGHDGFDKLTIRDNQVFHVGRTGIVVANSEYPRSADKTVRIAGNDVRYARGDSIIMIGVDGGRIDHNVSAYGGDLGSCAVARCGKLGGTTTASAAIWPSSANHIVIENNEVYGEHAKAGDGEAFDVDRGAKNVTLQYNYAHDNDGGGVMFCGAHDTTVRFNIFENNDKAAITFTCTDKVKNIKIYNNDIYASASTTANYVVRTLHGFGASGVSFNNNIVMSYGNSNYKWPAKVSNASNTFVGRHASTEPSGKGTAYAYSHLKNPGTGKNGFSSLKGYRLASTSTALKGIAIPTVTKDIFGKKVTPKKPFRGASSSK